MSTAAGAGEIGARSGSGRNFGAWFLFQSGLLNFRARSHIIEIIKGEDLPSADLITHKLSWPRAKISAIGSFTYPSSRPRWQS